MRVGRERERAIVAGLADEVVEGAGRLVAITGEAGIGKSRLVEAVVAALPGFASAWGRAGVVGGAPAYWPWTQVLRTLPAAHTTAPALAPLLSPGRPGVDEPFELHDAALRALTAAARERPLVVVLEDLHAAHAATLSLAAFVAGHLRGTRLLVLVTYREVDALHPHSTLLARLLREASHLPLGRLAVDEVRQLVDDAGLDPALAAEIYRASEGHPLQADELCRLHALAARRGGGGLVVRHEGEHWLLRLGGVECRLRDSRGLHMLARLVAEPGREIHVLELCRGGETGDAGEVIDGQAGAAYRARVRALRAELDEAEDDHDRARAERLAAELEALEAELARAFGLGGRPRRRCSAAERARVNVQRRLADTVKRARQAAPSLGAHLAASLATGTFCRYQAKS